MSPRPQPDKITIVINPDGTVAPDPATAFGNGDTNKADWVRWDNQADRGVRLEFTLWPFVEPPLDIRIEAGKMSDWFHIYRNADLTGYDYTVNPIGVPPPGEPQIDVQG